MTRHQYEKLIAKMEGERDHYLRRANDARAYGGRQDADHLEDRAGLWNDALQMVIRAEQGVL